MKSKNTCGFPKSFLKHKILKKDKSWHPKLLSIHQKVFYLPNLYLVLVSQNPHPFLYQIQNLIFLYHSITLQGVCQFFSCIHFHTLNIKHYFIPSILLHNFPIISLSLSNPFPKSILSPFSLPYQHLWAYYHSHGPLMHTFLENYPKNKMLKSFIHVMSCVHYLLKCQKVKKKRNHFVQ